MRAFIEIIAKQLGQEVKVFDRLVDQGYGVHEHGGIDLARSHEVGAQRELASQHS